MGLKSETQYNTVQRKACKARPTAATADAAPNGGHQRVLLRRGEVDGLRQRGRHAPVGCVLLLPALVRDVALAFALALGRAPAVLALVSATEADAVREHPDDVVLRAHEKIKSDTA